VPCNSTSRSGDVPARAWSPSMFWVTSSRSLPARSSSTMDFVDGVGPGLAKGGPALEFVIPMLNPRFFGSHEIVVVNRLTPCPDALGSAKVRDATAGRNARAGEDQDALGRAQESDEPFAQVGFAVHGPIVRRVRGGARGDSSAASARLIGLPLKPVNPLSANACVRWASWCECWALHGRSCAGRHHARFAASGRLSIVLRQQHRGDAAVGLGESRAGGFHLHLPSGHQEKCVPKSASWGQATADVCRQLDGR
jgi:hypothetical protein